MALHLWGLSTTEAKFSSEICKFKMRIGLSHVFLTVVPDCILSKDFIILIYHVVIVEMQFFVKFLLDLGISLYIIVGDLSEYHYPTQNTSTRMMTLTSSTLYAILNCNVIYEMILKSITMLNSLQPFRDQLSILKIVWLSIYEGRLTADVDGGCLKFDDYFSHLLSEQKLRN